MVNNEEEGGFKIFKHASHLTNPILPCTQAAHTINLPIYDQAHIISPWLTTAHAARQSHS